MVQRIAEQNQGASAELELETGSSPASQTHASQSQPAPARKLRDVSLRRPYKPDGGKLITQSAKRFAPSTPFTLFLPGIKDAIAYVPGTGLLVHGVSGAILSEGEIVEIADLILDSLNQGDAFALKWLIAIDQARLKSNPLTDRVGYDPVGEYIFGAIAPPTETLIANRELLLAELDRLDKIVYSFDFPDGSAQEADDQAKFYRRWKNIKQEARALKYDFALTPKKIFMLRSALEIMLEDLQVLEKILKLQIPINPQNSDEASNPFFGMAVSLRERAMGVLGGAPQGHRVGVGRDVKSLHRFFGAHQVMSRLKADLSAHTSPVIAQGLIDWRGHYESEETPSLEISQAIMGGESVDVITRKWSPQTSQLPAAHLNDQTLQRAYQKQTPEVRQQWDVAFAVFNQNIFELVGDGDFHKLDELIRPMVALLKKSHDGKAVPEQMVAAIGKQAVPEKLQERASPDDQPFNVALKMFLNHPDKNGRVILARHLNQLLKFYLPEALRPAYDDPVQTLITTMGRVERIAKSSTEYAHTLQKLVHLLVIGARHITDLRRMSATARETSPEHEAYLWFSSLVHNTMSGKTVARIEESPALTGGKDLAQLSFDLEQMEAAIVGEENLLKMVEDNFNGTSSVFLNGIPALNQYIPAVTAELQKAYGAISVAQGGLTQDNPAKALRHLALAQAHFLKIYHAPARASLVQKFEEREEYAAQVRTTVAVGSVVVSAGLSSLVGAGTRVLFTTLAGGRFSAVASLAAEGTGAATFVAANHLIENKLVGNPLPTKAEFVVETLLFGGMVKSLHGVLGTVAKWRSGLLFETASRELGLKAGQTLEALAPQLQQKIVTRMKELAEKAGWLTKSAWALENFGAEYLYFAGVWSPAEHFAKEGLLLGDWNGANALEACLNKQAFLDQLIFLTALKTGNHLTKPIIKEVERIVGNRLMQNALRNLESLIQRQSPPASLVPPLAPAPLIILPSAFRSLAKGFRRVFGAKDPAPKPLPANGAITEPSPLPAKRAMPVSDIELAFQPYLRLSFSNLLRPHFDTDRPSEVINKFLRGELGREPTHTEVLELAKLSRTTREEFWDSYRFTGHSGGQVFFQIYTKEFLDAYASYLEKLVVAFKTEHGRDPVIFEIAAGDGRFTRGLLKRLAAKGIKITATDLAEDNPWNLVFPPELVKMDAVTASAQADIILANWFPLAEDAGTPPFYMSILKRLRAHPEKVLIHTGQSHIAMPVTGSSEFWQQSRATRTLQGKAFQRAPDGLNYLNEKGDGLPLSHLNLSLSNDATDVAVLSTGDWVPDFKIGEARVYNSETLSPAEVEARAIAVRVLEVLSFRDEVMALARDQGITDPLLIMRLLHDPWMKLADTSDKLDEVLHLIGAQNPSRATQDFFQPQLRSLEAQPESGTPETVAKSTAGSNSARRQQFKAKLREGLSQLMDHELTFAPLLREQRQLNSDQDRLVTLHRFLRGELGREPTLAEVNEIKLMFQKEITDGGMPAIVFVYEITRPEGDARNSIHQIYTKEFLDAMAGYVLRLVEKFRVTHGGKNPRVLEICAGDGRLTRALNERLSAHGVRIRATDIKPGAKDVEQADALEAAQDADIILASWIYLDQHWDLRLAEMIAKPGSDKTLIQVESSEEYGFTNGGEFWDYVTRGPETIARLQPRSLNETPTGVRLLTDENTLHDETPRTQVSVYRSPDSATIPNPDKLESTLDQLREQRPEFKLQQGAKTWLYHPDWQQEVMSGLRRAGYKVSAKPEGDILLDGVLRLQRDGAPSREGVEFVRDQGGLMDSLAHVLEALRLGSNATGGQINTAIILLGGAQLGSVAIHSLEGAMLALTMALASGGLAFIVRKGGAAHTHFKGIFQYHVTMADHSFEVTRTEETAPRKLGSRDKCLDIHINTEALQERLAKVPEAQMGRVFAEVLQEEMNTLLAEARIILTENPDIRAIRLNTYLDPKYLDGLGLFQVGALALSPKSKGRTRNGRVARALKLASSSMNVNQRLTKATVQRNPFKIFGHVYPNRTYLIFPDELPQLMQRTGLKEPDNVRLPVEFGSLRYIISAQPPKVLSIIAPLLEKTVDGFRLSGKNRQGETITSDLISQRLDKTTLQLLETASASGQPVYLLPYIVPD